MAALSTYTPAAEYRVRLASGQQTSHARIAALIDELIDELDTAQAWVDECGYAALQAAEQAQAYWSCTYAAGRGDQ